MCIRDRTKISFRLNALAAFFGKGGLAQPSEITSRDIASLALLDVDDASLMLEGLYWVRSGRGNGGDPSDGITTKPCP